MIRSETKKQRQTSLQLNDHSSPFTAAESHQSAGESIDADNNMLSTTNAAASLMYQDQSYLAPAERHQTCEFPPDYLNKSKTRRGRVLINVGGQRHEIMWSTLNRIPNTRLGKLQSCVTHEQITAMCDDYDISRKEFFFDRHPLAFASIIDFYRTGKLHLLDDICVLSFTDELEFWGELALTL